MKSALGVFIAALAFPAPAQAAAPRAWVSGHGTDSPSCGAVVSPCRQIAYVLSNNIIAAGGEIDILDPTGFAPITIPFSVRIVNDGVGTASIQQAKPGQNAITISAGLTDRVLIRGLSLDGLSAGANGVLVTSAGAVTIENCFVANFVFNGISLAWTSLRNDAIKTSFHVSNTVLSDNQAAGINFSPIPFAFVTGTIDRVTATGGNAGVILAGAANVPTGAYNVLVSNSYFSKNVFGISLDFVNVTFSNTTSALNSTNDLTKTPSAQMWTFGDNSIQNTSILGGGFVPISKK